MLVFVKLPVELLAMFANELDESEDLAHLARSCRLLHSITNPILYLHAKDNAFVAHWAANECMLRTMEHVLAAGTDPNITWSQRGTMNTVLKSWHEAGLINQSSGHPTDDNEDSASPSSDDEDTVGYSTFSHMQCYWTPLHIAAQLNDQSMIKLLLSHGANPDPLSRGLCGCQYRGPEGLNRPQEEFAKWPLWKPLHTALCNGHDSAARLLLCHGASVDLASARLGSERSNVTALHVACRTGMLSTAKFIVENGYQVDVDVKDYRGWTPLVYAYRADEWPVIEWLVGQGANIDTELDGGTVFLDACDHGRFNEAFRFLELGADIHRTERRSGESALHKCCKSPPNIAHRMNGNEPRNYDDEQPAHSHVRDRLLRALIQAGAAIDQTSECYETPLLTAARMHSLDAMEILLDAGADTKAVDECSLNALHIACWRPENYTSNLGNIVRLLLDRGVEVAQQGAGQTALGYMCQKASHHLDQHLSSIRMLIELGGADPNRKEYGQWVLLELAFDQNFFGACDMLLEYGAEQPTTAVCVRMLEKVTICDNGPGFDYMYSNFANSRPLIQSETCLFDAIRGGKKEISKRLFAAGAPWTYRADDGSTCLTWASMTGDVAMTRLLLESGASPSQIAIDE
jgi:ankyrin repeat protein